MSLPSIERITNVCCCHLLENCSASLQKVPESSHSLLLHRFGIEEPLVWCGSHQKKVYNISTTCASCGVKKARSSLRPTRIGIWRFGDVVCTRCAPNPVPSLPAPVVDLREEITQAMGEPYGIMAVEYHWISDIATGDKTVKWLWCRISQDFFGKIILLRAKMPDGECRTVVGAVILGERLALRRPPDIPSKWRFPYSIRHYIPFSKIQCFCYNMTSRGGNPKWVTDETVIKKTVRALRHFHCALPFPIFQLHKPAHHRFSCCDFENCGRHLLKEKKIN